MSERECVHVCMCVYDDPLPAIGFNLVQICPEADLDQFCRDVSTYTYSSSTYCIIIIEKC